MKNLIVEEEYISRRVLYHILSSYGECDVAVDARNALESIYLSLGGSAAYDLVCLDSMMLGMDGEDLLMKTRELEARRGIVRCHGVKVTIFTASEDSDRAGHTSQIGCESYLAKPFDEATVFRQLEELGFLKAA